MAYIYSERRWSYDLLEVDRANAQSAVATRSKRTLKIEYHRSTLYRLYIYFGYSYTYTRKGIYV